MNKIRNDNQFLSRVHRDLISLLQKRGLPYSQIGIKMSSKGNPSHFYNLIRHPCDMRLSTLQKIASLLGYETRVLFVKKGR